MKAFNSHNSWLEVKTIIEEEAIDYYKCDGCGHIFKVGEKLITTIESCCGGCARNLCWDCIEYAWNLLKRS